MFKSLHTLLEMFRVMRRGHHLGDAAALKLTLIGESEAESRHQSDALAQVDRNFAHIDPKELATYPEGSFGAVYASFMARNELSPFNFTDTVRPLFERYPVSIRYVRIHDLVHVLLGFEADMVGEVGVYAFIGEQHYNDTLDRAAATAHRFSKLIFWKRRQMREAWARGAAMARGVPTLINLPLEDMLEMPLDEVRARLCIDTAPNTAQRAIEGRTAPAL